MQTGKKKKIHLVGIKGVGMTGLATLFLEAGNFVQGSDVAEDFFTDRILRDLGIFPTLFDEKNISRDIDCVIHSTAYTPENPEIKKAKNLGIRTRTYTEALADIFNFKKGIMVTGSHGKTTSSAMLAAVLMEAGWDPTVLVGGEILGLGRTARLGKSDWMVIEGDEYQAKILDMRPKALLITNVDYDHPDFYKTPEEYEEVFRKLADRVRKDGIVVEGPFNPALLGDIRLPLLGEFNKANAVGVVKIATLLGISEEVIKRALENFQGTRRRLEFYTSRSSPLVIIDDYAHHPTEVVSTLQAVREAYPERKIIVFFHPHTFSRTEVFLEDFAKAFGNADSVGILDVYGSMREKKGSIGGKELAEAISKYHHDVQFLGSVTEAERSVNAFAGKNNAVFITMGAGDVWRVASKLAGL